MKKPDLGYMWWKLSGAKARSQRLAKDQFNAILSKLGPSDVAMDLGANVGEFTKKMTETGAQTYAFEPDPHAANLLRDKLSNVNNVTIFETAVGAREETATLYRRNRFDAEPERATKSSSLFSDKSNMDAASGFEVQVMDFCKFATDLDHDIAIIKMDIEGAEVELMERLLDDPIANRIGEIFVATHERKLPELAARTAALKARTVGQDRPFVNWHWH